MKSMGGGAEYPERGAKEKHGEERANNNVGPAGAEEPDATRPAEDE
jgi:hypothetical protein